jgi:hypothetical protein
MKSLKENIGRLVRFQTLSGPESVQGGVTVTAVARSVRVGGERGLCMRAWPSAVLVSEEGRTSRLRIVDVTRWAQIAILLAALIWLFEIWMRTRTRKELS